MSRTTEPPVPTCYEVLHVHPAAPQDLITAAYWKLTGLLQASRESDKAAEVGLYNLTRAYQILADHRSREAYDHSLGLGIQPLPRVPLRRRSSWLPFGGRAPEVEADTRIDYYQIMRLDPNAHPAVVSEAYSVMRNQYLRLVEQGQARADLVYLLEEACDVLSNPAQRLQYDSSRGNKALTQRENGEAGNENDINEKNAVAAAVAVRPEQEDAVDDVRTEQNSVAANDDAGATDSQQPGEARPAGAEVAEQTANNGRTPAPRLWRRGRNSQVEEETPVSTTATDSVAVQERPAVRALRALAATSGKLLVKGGRESAHLAVLSSRALKELLERAQNGAAPVEEEEEAVLSRLFVTVADHSQPESAPEPRPLARLTVYDGEAAGISYDVCKVPLTLGEDDACDIKLAGLAPRQARLLYHSGHFVLHTLTDDPPTRFHGHHVPWTLLRDEDSVEVGPYRVSLSITQ